MKKTLLVFLFAVLGISTSAIAQEYWNFGVKGGVNFTNMTSDGFEENNSRTGFHLGVLAEIPVSDRFSFQPEVLYSTQGTEATRIFAGDRIEGEYQLDYIQVPLIAKFYVIDGLALEAGPSFNFLVQEEYDFESNTLNFEEDSDFASTFEFGGALGASYKFNNGFFLNGRYVLGFTDAFDSDSFDEDAIKNNGFQLGVGFIF
ncbi:porin family protein [Christiangramia sabulilitoris]|uniref:PorT family protein n=1 Tax=Christiangramia sabulilitoris TaxID=2583991 RepID=A0A550HX96_9FLAO|nr:porin family protein [Christiangramia sabulilitoris]TRO63295.1 PorT family protein [Christiangramia sabulilitoris]